MMYKRITVFSLLIVLFCRCYQPIEMEGQPLATCEFATCPQTYTPTYEEDVYILEIYDFESQLIKFSEVISSDLVSAWQSHIDRESIIVTGRLQITGKGVTYYWDGTDLAGKKVESGLYRVKISYHSDYTSDFTCFSCIVE